MGPDAWEGAAAVDTTGSDHILSEHTLKTESLRSDVKL